MWSVNTVPKVRSASLGFGLCAAAFTIRMASAMALLLLEDDRFPIEAEDLTVHVGDLAQRHVVLDRVHEDGHHVLAAAAGLGELLEAPFYLGHVARGLEPTHALHLLALHAFIETEELYWPLLRHHVLVHTHHHLAPAIVHELVSVRGVRDLLLRIAAVDGADDAAHVVDGLDVGHGPLFHLVSEALEEVRAAHGIDGERSARLLRDDLLGPERDGHHLFEGVGVERLRAPQHGGEGLDGHPRHVVERLLGGGRHPRGLGVGAQTHRLRPARAEAVAHHGGPDATGRP